MTPLCRANLPRLSAAIATPGHDPAEVTPGIVHLGLGGFHRAHMARYTDDLMRIDREALRWGIVGAGLLPADRMVDEGLVAQDGLYTLVERNADGEKVSVIGSIAEVIFAGDSTRALLAAIDQPSIGLVSLTITEAGYRLEPARRRLDLDDPLIAADLSASGAPRTAVGVIVEAYRRRRASGTPPFTALSCDNIQRNGEVLRDAVLDFAAQVDPALAEWIGVRARFPSTMVDRITPVTRPEDIAGLAARHGLADAAPVFCEPFRQWVIEDDFAAGRPRWETVGARFVSDVAPYELMKLRLLNASHLAISCLGRLIGCAFVHEAMNEALLSRYMAALIDRETGPTLPSIPGVDLAAYKAELIRRFGNPTLRDTVERVNTDAPLNVLLDPMGDRIARGQSVALLALGLAAWIRRVRGEDERGEAIEVRHGLAAELRKRAIAGGADPRPVLSLTPLFAELGQSEFLISAVGGWLGSLYESGAARTLARAAEELGF